MKCKDDHVCSLKERIVFSYKLQWYEFTERSEAICQLVLVLNNALRVEGVWGRRDRAPHFLSLGKRWRHVISLVSVLLDPSGKSSSTHWTEGSMGPGIGLDALDIESRQSCHDNLAQNPE